MLISIGVQAQMPPPVNTNTNLPPWTNYVARPPTNPVPYQVISVTNGGQPVIQFSRQDELYVNCYSNSTCYVEAADNPFGPWHLLEPARNNQHIQIDNTSSNQFFFRARQVPSKFFVRFKKSPLGDETTVFAYPDYLSKTTGAWLYETNACTNTTGWFPMYSNTLVWAMYPTNTGIGSITTNWPCAEILELTKTASGVTATTNTILVDHGYYCQAFDIGWVSEGRAVYQQTAGLQPMVVVPCQMVLQYCSPEESCCTGTQIVFTGTNFNTTDTNVDIGEPIQITLPQDPDNIKPPDDRPIHVTPIQIPGTGAIRGPAPPAQCFGDGFLNPRIVIGPPVFPVMEPFTHWPYWRQ